MQHYIHPTISTRTLLAHALRLFATLVLLLALFGGAPARRTQGAGGAGSLDTSFDPRGSDVNNTVEALAVQYDSKVVIGGTFTRVNGRARNRIARLNVDGSLDPTFNPGSGPNSNVYALAVQEDDKIVIGGAFTQVNGTTRNRIARLNADGSLDPTFNPGSGPNGDVRELAVWWDGKVIIGGDFTTVNGTARNRIARLNADGSLDTTFDPAGGPNSNVYALAVQVGGKLLIGGSFTQVNGTTRNSIARLNADGSLDPAFNPGSDPNGSVYALAVQVDGKLLVGGSFTQMNGTTRNSIARLNADGSLDPTFNPGSGTDGNVYALVVHYDGKILVGGSFTQVNGTARNRIARLKTDGSLDTTFDPGSGLNGNVYALAVQWEDKIAISGVFTQVNGVVRNFITRLNADGSLDTSFNTSSGTNSIVRALAAQGDGKIVIGGAFTQVNSVTRNHIARLNADGSLDTTFNPGSGANDGVWDLAEQDDGKIVIGGAFTSVNGTLRNRIARLNADGSLDTSFNPTLGPNDAVWALAVQDDGKIVIGGAFNSVNGISRRRIARLNVDGSLDTTFDPGSGPNIYVGALAVQDDGKIVIGGAFTSVNGTPRSRIARLNPDGSLDTSFNPGSGLNSTLYDLVVQSDGKIVIGGAFTSVNGISRNRIARLSGGLIAAWAAGDSADKTLMLPIVDDALLEGDETVELTLTAHGSAVVGTPSALTLTIQDNDQQAPAITSQLPPAGTYGAAYSHTFTAGGTPASIFSLNGMLPPGLSFNIGTISGTPTQAGTYSNITVTASNGFNSDATQTFTITIDKAPLTVTAENKSRTYGQDNPALTFTSSAFVNGDTAESALIGSLSTTATAASAVGSYDITQGTLDAANYAISFIKGTATVHKAPLTVTAENKSRRVGQPNGSLALLYSGLFNGDDADDLDTPPSAAASADANSSAGTYDITVDGGQDANYSFSYVKGTLTVTAKDIPVIAWSDPAGITYGMPLGAAQLNAATSFGGQPLAGTFTYDPPLGTVLNAGTGQVLEVTFTPDDTVNYASVTAQAQIDVAKAPLIIIAEGKTIVAGAAIPTLTARYEGFVNSDTAASLDTPPTLATSATASSPAGTYEIVAGGAEDTNYAISFVKGTLTVQANALPTTYLPMILQ